MSAIVLTTTDEPLSVSFLESELVQKRVNRLDPLLTLRGLACMIVLVGHCFIAMPSLSTNLVVFGQNLTWALCPYAAVGMYIFFTLSGYLMGHMFFCQKYKFSRSGLSRFFQSRFLRLAPLFYALLSFYLIFTAPEYLKPQHFHHLLKLFTFTYNIWPFEFQAQHFWSIAVEMQFYLLVPFLFLALRPLSRNGFSLAMAVVVVISLVAAYRIIEFPKTILLDGHQDVMAYFRRIYFSLIGNFDTFFIGFWLNAFFQWRENLSAKYRLQPGSPLMQVKFGWIAMFGWLLVSSFLFHDPEKSMFYVQYGVYPVATALVTSYFIATARAHENYDNAPLSFQSWRSNKFRTFEMIGVLSYGIYLWHVVLIKMMMSIFVETTALEGYFLLIATTTVAAILFATVTYIGIEKPFNKLRYRRFS